MSKKSANKRKGLTSKDWQFVKTLLDNKVLPSQIFAITGWSIQTISSIKNSSSYDNYRDKGKAYAALIKKRRQYKSPKAYRLPEAVKSVITPAKPEVTSAQLHSIAALVTEINNTVSETKDMVSAMYKIAESHEKVRFWTSGKRRV